MNTGCFLRGIGRVEKRLDSLGCRVFLQFRQYCKQLRPDKKLFNLPKTKSYIKPIWYMSNTEAIGSIARRLEFYPNANGVVLNLPDH